MTVIIEHIQALVVVMLQIQRRVVRRLVERSADGEVDAGSMDVLIVVVRLVRDREKTARGFDLGGFARTAARHIQPITKLKQGASTPMLLLIICLPAGVIVAVRTDIIPFGQTAPGLQVPKLVVPMNGLT